MYLGNTPTQQSFVPAVDVFSGNGSTTAFTLSRTVASVAQVEAFIENVPQSPVDAFTVSGNTITFTSAPPSGSSNIYVRYTSPITQVMQPSDNSVGYRQLSSDLQGATYGMKNRIINGAMQVWQRGASFTLSSGVTTYVADRWYVNTTGGAGVVTQTGSVGAYSLRITGASGVTSGFFGQKIESVNIADLAGSTVTYKIRASSSVLTSLTWYARFPTAQDNYTGVTAISNGTINITSTPTDYSFQIALPAGVNNGLEVYFQFGAFTSGTLDVTLVQLEKGSTATSFDYRPYGTELALCQRYYYRLKAGTAYANAGVGRAYSTTNCQVMVAMPVSMRAAPTSTGYSALTDWNAAQTGGNITAMSPAAQYSLDYRQMTIDVTATFTNGQSNVMNANNTTNAWIEWSAEL